jgi:hypothetical protein
MKKTLLMVLVLVACLLPVYLQGQNNGQINAAQYGEFRVSGLSAGGFSFPPATCQVSAGGRNFAAFSAGAPIKIVDSNPYTKGGEFDQTINNGLANVSDAGANSLAGALQAQARRTGQNSVADAATAAAGAQQNTRDLSSDLAHAQQSRIAGEAGYNQAALGASALPVSANQSLYGTSSNAADSLLGDETQAAKTPSFWDEVGSGVAGNLGKIGKL